MITHASLFSGIGGFDMAATWMGWKNVFSCEKDPFCRKILNFYWPETKNYDDICNFEAAEYRGRINILTGGFPCQPFSLAGRRKGTNDNRYLWPEALRIITTVRPGWIVLENVAGLFTVLEPESISEMEIKAMQLFCSDTEQEANATILRLQRRVIGTIISEIGAAGYLLPQMEDGTPVVLCVPACAIDAPHRRDRIWFVAHAQHGADSAHVHPPGHFTGDRTHPQERPAATAFDNRWSGNAGKGWPFDQQDVDKDHGFATYTHRKGLEGSAGDGAQGRGSAKPAWYDTVPGWNEWPAQSPVCSRDDGLSGRLDGITFPKWRSESIKAFGNAIVPQVALELFRSIAVVANLA